MAEIPITEERNIRTVELDRMSAREIVEVMNQEDATVADAVCTQLDAIARAVDVIVEKLRSGGRLLYFGAGTSGRLALLDAAECPPTFRTPPHMVQAFIAGGPDAVYKAQEGAEDSVEAGASEAISAGVSQQDAVVGVAASGHTPYVSGALDAARNAGATTIAVVCSLPSPLANIADITIAPITGPEVLSGSTRLKAGTAQKMVLNMLSTASMVRLGKVYENWMVDVAATNQKLRARAIRIVCEVAKVNSDEARRILESTDYHVKPALVMLLANVDFARANALLAASQDRVREAISLSQK